MAKGKHAALRTTHRARNAVVAVATPAVLLGVNALPADATRVPTCRGVPATLVVAETGTTG